jgi:hypothetical protein
MRLRNRDSELAENRFDFTREACADLVRDARRTVRPTRETEARSLGRLIAIDIGESSRVRRPMRHDVT